MRLLQALNHAVRAYRCVRPKKHISIYKNFWKQSLFVLAIIILSACSSIIPATTPPQLEHIASAEIIITDETVNAGIFQVDYPDGWRVIKLSVAGDPIELVFASPDDDMWIKISETPIFIEESTPTPNIYERIEILEIDDTEIYVQGRSPIELREEFDEIYENLLDSIKIP